MIPSEYDSTSDTLKHIKRVNELLIEFAADLLKRAQVHDASKLLSPEKEAFDLATPKLAASTYGSEEYKGLLDELKPALDHHYAHNSHHPEHKGKRYVCIICFSTYEVEPNTCAQCRNGTFSVESTVNGMTLLDIVEMLADWKAAGERHNNGSITRSLEVNQKRFFINDQLQGILKNTVEERGWK